jgi:DNA-binding NarL/FixJ family response regulator
MTKTCRIILADDHTIFRQGLRKLLLEKPGVEVIGEVRDGLELVKLLNKVTPDLIILDISMPNLRGLEAIREIKPIWPEIRILILTMHRERDYFVEAISAGAEGYLLKEDADTELYSAIQMIQEKKIYVSPSLSEELREEWAQILRGKREIPFTPLLTNREREVLKLIAEGKSSKKIAGLLDISARTVDRHRANIMKKLNLKKSADLVRYALQGGYL